MIDKITFNENSPLFEGEIGYPTKDNATKESQMG